MTTIITIRGKKVDNTLIAAYVKRINSTNDVVTVFANAAVIQAAVHGNKNWLDKLFSLPVMTLRNGDLSKLGTQVLNYCKAHCPRVEWSKENQKVGLKKFNADSPLATNFVAVGVTEEQAANIEGATVVKGKVYLPHGDFNLTFDEFLNLEKPESADKPEPSLAAKALVKQLEKAVAFHKDGKLSGTADEVLAAAAHAKMLFTALDALHTKMVAVVVADEEKQVDAALAAQLLQSGQAGKATRAGKKAAVAA